MQAMRDEDVGKPEFLLPFPEQARLALQPRHQGPRRVRPQRRCLFAALGGGQFRFVDSERLGYDFVYAHAGIERGEGVLKDHLHLATTSP